VLPRVFAALDAVRQQHPGERVLLVCHAGVIYAVEAYLKAKARRRNPQRCVCVCVCFECVQLLQGVPRLVKGERQANARVRALVRSLGAYERVSTRRRPIPAT